jgi:hypothetical protein
MRSLFIVVIMSVLYLLSGCAPVYQTTYSYVPPKSDTGRMCAMQCQQTRMMCQQLCESRKETCRSNARQQALFDYESYKHQRRARGKSVDRDVESFYDDFQCDDIPCGCDESYNSCFAVCGGQVVPTTVCIAFCNNK